MRKKKPTLDAFNDVFKDLTPEELEEAKELIFEYLKLVVQIAEESERGECTGLEL